MVVHDIPLGHSGIEVRKFAEGFVVFVRGLGFEVLDCPPCNTIKMLHRVVVTVPNGHQAVECKV